MEKQNVILAGPFVGEFGWHVLRFAPHVLYYKNQNPEAKLIVWIRHTDFDLYGSKADILKPLIIEGDGQNYKANCFGMINFPVVEYYKMVEKFYKEYADKYNVIKHIYAETKGKKYTEKNQFPWAKMLHKFDPRKENKILVDSWLPQNKKTIVLAPRFRNGIARNWDHWQELYDMIWDSNIPREYNIVLCGKNPDYVQDTKNRFLDINKIKLTENTSLVGITIEVLKRSIVCCGSQSGVPNLSNLVRTPTIQWGHQQSLHSTVYNVHKTKTVFIPCSSKKNFNEVPARQVYKSLSKFIRRENNG